MSAPDTNVEKQEKRHKPALLGIRAAMVFGALMMVGLAIYVMTNGDDDSADAVTNTDQATEPEASTPAVDTYAPGTNESN